MEPYTGSASDADKFNIRSSNEFELNRMLITILQKIRSNADRILDQKDITFSGWTKRSARIITDYNMYQLQYSSPYAHFVEFGLPPWQAGNLDMHALRNWVEGKLGVPREDSELVTEKIAGKLTRDGYRGYRFLRKAIKMTVGQVGVKKLEKQQGLPGPTKEKEHDDEDRFDRVIGRIKKMRRTMNKLNRIAKNPFAAAGGMAFGYYRKRKKRMARENRRREARRSKPRRARGRKLPMYEPSLKNFRYEGGRRRRYRADKFIKTEKSAWQAWSHDFQEDIREPIWKKVYGDDWSNVDQLSGKKHKTAQLRKYDRFLSRKVQDGSYRKVPKFSFMHPAAFMGGRPSRTFRSTRYMHAGPTATAGLFGGLTPPQRDRGWRGRSSRPRAIRTPTSLMFHRRNRRIHVRKQRSPESAFRKTFSDRKLFRERYGYDSERPPAHMRIFARFAENTAHQQAILNAQFKQYVATMNKKRKKSFNKHLVKKPKSVATMRRKPHKKSYLKRGPKRKVRKLARKIKKRK